MAAKKGSKSRAGKSAGAKHDMPYGMAVFYVIIGLIMGMAIGALALLYVARVQNDYENSVNSTQGQLLNSYQSRY